MDITAYVDESGNTNLDTSIKDVSKYFVVAAIIIKAQDIREFDESVSSIRAVHFSGSEIKSSNVRRNLARRISVLSSINKLEFSSHIVAIDKTAIFKTGGLIFKQPFLKFTNGILYRKLFRSFQHVSVFCDQHGSKEFQDSFKSYLENTHRQDLFKDSEVTPIDSKDSNGVQIADFIAGSVREILEYGKSKELFSLIKEKSSLVEVWPPKKSYFIDKFDYPQSESHDNSVEDYCVAQAKAYVERNHLVEEEDELLKLRIIEILLAMYYADETISYLTTKEIMEFLFENEEPKSEQYVRQKIAEIREDDVIIASSSNGLKIPTTVFDLGKYVEENKKKIIPMIDRLSHARNQIKLATVQQYDILNEHTQLKKILDAYEFDKFTS